MGDAQIFCQMKGLMKICNRGKFHLHSICGSKVINSQKFLWRCSIHEYGSILLKLAPEVFFEETQTVFQEFWKNSNFCRNGTYPKFLHLVPLWPCFSTWRWRKLKKIKNEWIKFSHQAIQKSQNQGRISCALPMINRITFCTFGAFFGENLGMVTH